MICFKAIMFVEVEDNMPCLCIVHPRTVFIIDVGGIPV